TGGRIGDVEGREVAAAIKETVEGAGAAAEVIPNDLARVVDALGEGLVENAGNWGIVERGVGAAAIEEGVGPSGGRATVAIIAGDLPRIIDATRIGAVVRRIIERGVHARGIEEAVIRRLRWLRRRIEISPYDLARTIDAVGEGLSLSRGIV